jgi:hypothetical protein
MRSVINSHYSLGAAYVRGDRRADAERLLAELEEKRRRQHVSAVAMAMVAVALGEAGRAYRWLETAVEDADGSLVILSFFLYPGH